MKLISCHIENFGKLSDFDMDFHSGLNQICADNGWGKSTLAAFLRAMFYGLTGTRKHTLMENERKRYQPWQGGTFGGSLTFEAKGKRYQVTRTFGKKESEDTFELKNAITNLDSRDFTSDLGTELFQVDRDSFQRTVFIRQEDAEYSGTTAGISAKIGNLSENTDDMNNYDTADALLQKYLNSESPKRVTGNLYREKEEIETLKAELRKAPEIERQIREQREQKQKAEEERKELQKKKSERFETQKVLIAIRARKIQQEQLDDLYQEEEKRRRQKEEYRARFGEEVPGQAELAHVMKESSSLQKNLEMMNHYRLSDAEAERLGVLDKQFGTDIPSESRKDEILQDFQKTEKLRAYESDYKLSLEENDELDLLLERFRVGIPSNEEIDEKIRVAGRIREQQTQLDLLRRQEQEQKEIRDQSLAKIQSLQKEDDQQAAREALLRQEQKRKKREEIQRYQKRIRTGTILILTAFAAVGAGILLRETSVLLWICFGLGVALAVTGLLMLLTAQKRRDAVADGEGTEKRTQNPQSHGEKIAQEKAALLAAGEQLQKNGEKLASLEASQQADEQQLADFLSIFGIEYEQKTVEQELYDIRHDVTRYDRLLDKRRVENEQDQSQIINELLEEVRAELKKYEDKWDAPVTELSEVVQKYDQDVTEALKLTEKRRQYETYAQREKEEQAEIETFLKRTLPAEVRRDIHTSSDIPDVLRGMNAGIVRYETARKEEEKAICARKAFQEEHPEIVRSDPDQENEEKNPEENQIEEQIAALTDEMDERRDQMAACDRIIGELDDRLDSMERLKTQIQGKEQKYQKNLHRYDLVIKTRSLLKEAREQFTAQYMRPIMDRFQKYCRLMTGREEENFRIDANVRLTRKEEGAWREIDTQSEGWKDLIGVSMRMALVDVMYQEEKPAVIFDDPFVNLDEEKTIGAMRFLKEIAKEYQVIYFTCHDSRKI